MVRESLAKYHPVMVGCCLCFTRYTVRWVGSRSSNNLSKRPSILKLDSLLQEVCIMVNTPGLMLSVGLYDSPLKLSHLLTIIESHKGSF